MDNVCHTLVGAALGAAGLKRTTRLGSATLMIAANLPDLDVLVFATSTPSVAFRRGWTHGIAAQLVLPLLLAAVMWLLARRRPSSDPPARLSWLIALAVVGVWSHVFLDYLNNYGVRLLAPLDWRWFYGDAVFIVDPWLWLMLGVGVWVARRRGVAAPARWSLVLATVYVAVMLIAARTARAVVADAWTALRGAAPRALMVGPVPVTPFRRDVIVDAGDYYQRGVLSWPGGFTTAGAPIPKNEGRSEVAAAREAAGVRAFLVWSRFPFWTVTETAEGARVTVSDARFMAAGQLFSATAVVPAAARGEGDEESR